MARGRRASRTSRALPEGAGRWLLIALGWAAASRAAYFFLYSKDPLYGHLLHDAKRYHEWAAAWAEGNRFEEGPFYQAPLYPWLLSLVYRVVGPIPAAAYGLQLIGGCATVVLVHRVGGRIGGARAGALAAALAALYGTLLFYETKLLPASLAVFLSALLVDRLQVADASRSPVVFLPAGLVLGLASLTNPSSLLALPLALAWIAAERARSGGQRLRRAGWLVAGSLAAIVPASASNYRASGELVLVSANGGVTFYQGNHAGARGVFAAPEGFSGSIFTQREESHALAERESGRPLRDGEVSSFWFRKGLRFAIEQPAAWLALEARKLLLAVSSVELPLEYHPRLDGNPARWLAPAPFALVLALASLRLVLGRRTSRAEGPVWILLGAVLGTLLLFYVSSRYRLSAMPALASLGGWGAAMLWERGRAAPRAVAVPGLLAAAVLLGSAGYAPLAQRGLLSVLDARGLADLAEARRAAGCTEEAVALYRRAVALNPRDAYARLDLSKALRAAGDLSAAERELRETVRRAPALAEARYDLGVLLFESGRLEEAAVEFREASRLEPASAPAANNLLGTLLKLGSLEEALEVHHEMVSRGLPVDPPLAAWASDARRRLRSPTVTKPDL